MRWRIRHCIRAVKFHPVCHPWRAKQSEKGCENVIGGATGKGKGTVNQRVARKELLQGRLGGKITDIAAVPRRVERGRPTLERPVAEGRPEARAASPGARKAGPTAVKASAAPRAPRRAIDVICIVEDVESMALLETERSNAVLVTSWEHKLCHAGNLMREKALWRRKSCAANSPPLTAVRRVLESTRAKVLSPLSVGRVPLTGFHAGRCREAGPPH